MVRLRRVDQIIAESQRSVDNESMQGQPKRGRVEITRTTKQKWEELRGLINRRQQLGQAGQSMPGPVAGPSNAAPTLHQMLGSPTRYPAPTFLMPQPMAPAPHAPLGPGVLVGPVVWTELLDTLRSIQNQIMLVQIALKDLATSVVVLRDMSLKGVAQPPIVHSTTTQFMRGTSGLEGCHLRYSLEYEKPQK